MIKEAKMLKKFLEDLEINLDFEQPYKFFTCWKLHDVSLYRIRTLRYHSLILFKKEGKIRYVAFTPKAFYIYYSLIKNKSGGGKR